MKHTAIKCPSCKDIVFSIAHHDYHSCTCGEVTVDGGFEYFRFGWAGDKPEILEIEIPKKTVKQYYKIWSKSLIDKPYGVIKEKK